MQVKKLFILTLACISLFALSANAQNNNVVESYRPDLLRFAVAGQGIYNGYPFPGNIGVSLDAKLFINSHHANSDAFNEYVATIKGLHTFATDGPVYGSFDKGVFNNVSAVIGLVGYRFNFGAPRSFHRDFKRDSGGWFVELNAGGAYYRFAKTLRPVVSPMAGYAISKNLDIVASYTGSWNHRKGRPPLAAFGLGIMYDF